MGDSYIALTRRVSMLETENAALKWTLAHVRGDAEAYSNVSGELCLLPPVKIPRKMRASPVYLFACMQRSFVDSPPTPIFESLELMSNNLCVVKEAPTPPSPLTPALFQDAPSPVRVVGNTRHPVTEGPLMRGPSFSYKKYPNNKVFKQRSSYDTVVTKANAKKLFFDVYLNN